MPVSLCFAISGGAIRVEVTAETAREAIEQAAFFQAMPDQCPICKAGWKLTHRKPKTQRGPVDYYALRCLGTPAHEINCGIHLGDGTLFFDEKKGWAVPPSRSGDNYEEDDPSPRGGQSHNQHPSGSTTQNFRPPGQNRGGSGGGGGYGRGGR